MPKKIETITLPTGTGTVTSIGPGTVRITVLGLKTIQRKIKASKKATEKAEKIALLSSAKKAQQRVTRFIPQVFDNPTPFTRGAISRRPRRLSHFTNARHPYAEVFIKDIGGGRQHYLEPQITGGRRKQKRAEKRLEGYWVPGKDAKKNRYGNLTKGTWSKILADVGRFGLYAGDASNTLTRKERKARGGKGGRIQYFMRTHKKGKRIIYKRVGENITPWLIEVSKPGYRRRLPLQALVKHAFFENYSKRYARALDEQLAKVR